MADWQNFFPNMEPPEEVASKAGRKLAGFLKEWWEAQPKTGEEFLEQWGKSGGPMGPISGVLKSIKVGQIPPPLKSKPPIMTGIAHGPLAASVEELARPGVNYAISKSGVEHLGKQVDMPRGADAVIARLPNGEFQVRNVSSELAKKLEAQGVNRTDIDKVVKERYASKIPPQESTIKIPDFKYGDFVTFEAPDGRILNGKIRDVDPYSKEAWIFSEDRSIHDAGDSITIPFSKVKLR